MVEPTRSFIPTSPSLAGTCYPPRSPGFPRLPSIALGQSGDPVVPEWPMIHSSTAPGSEPSDIPHPPSPQLERVDSTEAVYALGLSVLNVQSEPDNICPLSYD